jgi:hypothetical protein
VLVSTDHIRIKLCASIDPLIPEDYKFMHFTEEPGFSSFINFSRQSISPIPVIRSSCIACSKTRVEPSIAPDLFQPVESSLFGHFAKMYSHLHFRPFPQFLQKCASCRDDPCEFFLSLVGVLARESAKINDELIAESMLCAQFTRLHVVHEEHLSLFLTLSSTVLTSFQNWLRFRSRDEREITRTIVELPRIVVIDIRGRVVDYSRLRLDEELRLPARSGEQSCRLIAVGLRRLDSGMFAYAFKAVRSCVRREDQELSLLTDWPRLRETGLLAKSCATVLSDTAE